MDKTILCLLFNWKGSINSREFRAGMSILFFTAGCLVNLMLINVIFFIFIGWLGNHMLATASIFNQIVNDSIPMLVPFGFILTYSSFVLAVKRMRLFTTKKMLIILSGVINYFFFASLVTVIKIGLNSAQLDGNISFSLSPFLPVLTWITVVITIIGFIHFILLALLKNDKAVVIRNKALNPVEYALKIGKLIGITAIINSLFMLIFLKYGLIFAVYEEWMLYLVIGLPVLILLIFYIKYTVLRLKDAGLSVNWLIGVLGIYILVCIFVLFSFKNLGTWIIYEGFIFSIITNIFIAAQYALFIIAPKQQDIAR